MTSAVGQTPKADISGLRGPITNPNPQPDHMPLQQPARNNNKKQAPHIDPSVPPPPRPPPSPLVPSTRLLHAASILLYPVPVGAGAGRRHHGINEFHDTEAGRRWLHMQTVWLCGRPLRVFCAIASEWLERKGDYSYHIGHFRSVRSFWSHEND